MQKIRVQRVLTSCKQGFWNEARMLLRTQRKNLLRLPAAWHDNPTTKKASEIYWIRLWLPLWDLSTDSSFQLVIFDRDCWSVFKVWENFVRTKCSLSRFRMGSLIWNRNNGWSRRSVLALNLESLLLALFVQPPLMLFPALRWPLTSASFTAIRGRFFCVFMRKLSFSVY